MTGVARRGWVLGTAVAAALAWACSGTGSPTAPDPSSAGTSAGAPQGAPSATGSLAVHITDSPFSDARALLVTFGGVSVHRADGDSWQTVPFVSGGSRTCDLKKLNGPVDVLGVGALPVGKYTQVRLLVSTAAIYFDNPSVGGACAASIAPPAGQSAIVDIPSGEVKLNREFTLTTAGSTMLLDFDGEQSVRQTGSGNANGNGKGNGQSGSGGAAGKYMMTPTIRVVSVQ
ncbi:MAG TPA: DUF4382 domain-containing protein [Vicinamibacterales bacterium]|nr:DUF4382 domain-containing protein [Vicinamibacterales bacterium]